MKSNSFSGSTVVNMTDGKPYTANVVEGGQIGGTMEKDAITRSELDARFHLVDARIENKLIQIDAKFDKVLASLERVSNELKIVKEDNKNTRTVIISTVVASIMGVSEILCAKPG